MAFLDSSWHLNISFFADNFLLNISLLLLLYFSLRNDSISKTKGWGKWARHDSWCWRLKNPTMLLNGNCEVTSGVLQSSAFFQTLRNRFDGIRTGVIRAWKQVRPQDCVKYNHVTNYLLKVLHIRGHIERLFLHDLDFSITTCCGQ